MPTLSARTLATGARQLVVQDAFDTTSALAVNRLSLTPKTMVWSAFLHGADTSTFFAPAARCAADASRLLNFPEHSRTISTPCAACGILAGSRSRLIWILPLPTSIQS